MVLLRSFALARPARLGLCLLAAWGVPAPARAQQDTGFDTSRQWRIEQPGKNHVRLVGQVEARRGDMTFHADEVDSFTDTHRVVAAGHVVFTQGENRIYADRAEFNTETRLGTFHNASGSAVVGDESKRSMLGGQEPDVYFYGERIEKIGPKKYKITNGAFSTCVQPTPRWEVTSGTVILNVDHYAFLKNALLKAKGLPILYFPVMYYPINKEDRATGFLMPSYGLSSYRGFTLSNAFFWAIGRSQDATFMHDWFSKRGQGFGGEYRYVRGPGAMGNMRVYNLREHESEYTSDSGVTTTQAARTSYEIQGNLNQPLGGRWTARARVDYFSDVTVQQTYHTNIYDASRSRRSVNGSVTGAIGQFLVNGTAERSEYFQGQFETTRTGTMPKIQVSRGEKPIPGIPAYFSLTGEWAELERVYTRPDSVSDSSLSRFDFLPTVRVPFTALRWLTLNSSVSWRGTWWSRSRVEGTNVLLDQAIARQFVQLDARLVGPVLNRVWTTPDNGYADKFKHTVEPFLNFQYVTQVENFDEIIQLDTTDYIVGGTTRLQYGVTNRLLAKRRGGPAAGSSREFINVGLSQSYYTDARASQYDYNYSTSYTGQPPSNFSPVSLSSRISPTEELNGSLRLEYDHEAGAIRSISANGQYLAGGWLSVTGGYSQRRVLDTVLDADASTGTAVERSEILQAPGSRLRMAGDTRLFRQDNSVNVMTTLRTSGNRLGGSYTVNYDIGRGTLLASRIVTYYNAQCCGVAVEYQTVNFPQSSAYPVPQDNRFNIAFTLAGLGTFSNFFGALGGGR